MKNLVWKLAASSVALTIIGLAIFPLSMELSQYGSTVPDERIEVLGFLAMVVIAGIGLSLGVASLCVAAFLHSESARTQLKFDLNDPHR